MSLEMNGSTRSVRIIGVCYIHDKVQSMSLEINGSTGFVRYIGVCDIHDKVQSMSLSRNERFHKVCSLYRGLLYT